MPKGRIDPLLKLSILLTLCIHLIRRKKTLKTHILQVLAYGPIFQLLSKFTYPPRVKRGSRDYREIYLPMSENEESTGQERDNVGAGDILRPASRMRLQSHGTPGSSVRSSLATRPGRFRLSLLSIVPGDFPSSVSFFLSFSFSLPLTSSFSVGASSERDFQICRRVSASPRPEFPGGGEGENF